VVTTFEKIRQLYTSIQPKNGTVLIFSKSVRLFTWLLSYLIFKTFQVKPNQVSTMGILTGLIASLFALRSEYFLFTCCVLIWTLLDCIDGELARLSQNFSSKGLILEKINSDLQYALWIPALSIGLFSQGYIKMHVLYAALISTAMFVALRSFLNTVPQSISQIHKDLRSFIGSQFKDGDLYRKESIFGKALYIFWRNGTTQFGLFPFYCILFIFYRESLVEFVVVQYFLMYFMVSLGVIVGLFFTKQLNTF
jgi:hypothetical protein